MREPRDHHWRGKFGGEGGRYWKGRKEVREEVMREEAEGEKVRERCTCTLASSQGFPFASVFVFRRGEGRAWERG